MENKIMSFSRYSYRESTINSEVAENAIIIQKVRTVKNKVLFLLKDADINPDLFEILNLYFNLNNSRPEEILSEQKIWYLNILSYQLIKLLKQESIILKEELLLTLFVHLNFNKDQIIKYYINKIDRELENNPDDQD